MFEETEARAEPFEYDYPQAADLTAELWVAVAAIAVTIAIFLLERYLPGRHPAAREPQANHPDSDPPIHRERLHVEALSEHLIQGQKIHSKLRKTRGKPEPTEYMVSKAWSTGVEKYLNEHLREHLATFRMPNSAPRAVYDGMNSQRAFYLNSFEVQLENLRKVIDDLRH